MVSISITKDAIQKSKNASSVFFMEEKQSFPTILKGFDKHCVAAVQAYAKQTDFKPKAGSILVLPVLLGKKLTTIVIIGLGKKTAKKKIAIEVLRRSVGKLVRLMQQKKIQSASIQFPDVSFFQDANAEYCAEQIAMIAQIAAYQFADYITDKERKLNQKLDFALHVTNNESDVKKGVKRGLIVAESVNKARHWIDLPPCRLTPPELASNAEKIAKKRKLKCTIFDEAEIKAMGMGGLAAVSAGSDKDCKFVIMEYKVDKKAPTLAFVGKGITFDSGGLSLKPPAYMETMKEDMSGAAAVIAAMDVIGQLKPNVNVIGITPLSENLPSGTATKPGDIITFYNGKTAQVENTDAEGRLILADALAYADKHYKPDMMIDLATLTGACAYALGPFYSGLMSKYDDVVDKVQVSAKRSGDHVWRLPLDDDYKPAIKTVVADINNCGSRRYMAGAITAGLFLENFVGSIPWAHLDIAGTAFNVPDISYYRSHSATGVGVRLLVDLAMHWK